MYTWGAILWVVVQGQPKLYEEYVTNTISLRHDLIQINKYIVELKHDYGNKYVVYYVLVYFEGRCLKVSQKVTDGILK